MEHPSIKIISMGWCSEESYQLQKMPFGPVERYTNNIILFFKKKVLNIYLLSKNNAKEKLNQTATKMSFFSAGAKRPSTTSRPEK